MRILCLGGFLTFAFLAGLVFVFFGGGEMSMVYWKVWLSPRSVPKAEGVTLYIGKQGGAALKAIRPAEELLDRTTPAFGLSPRRIGRRVKAAAEAAGLGEGFTGHSAPEPTVEFTQQELDEAEEQRQSAGILWFAAAKACTESKYSGRRKQSDIQCLLVSQEINDQMMAELNGLPHHEEMTPEQKLEAVKIFRAATTKLLDLCLPPGVELGGD